MTPKTLERLRSRKIWKEKEEEYALEKYSMKKRIDELEKKVNELNKKLKSYKKLKEYYEKVYFKMK